MKATVNPRYSFVEHLTEAFSASCNSVCNQANIDPTTKVACDIGSQAYCTSSTNDISSPSCATYLDRLVRTRAAQKTNIAYANAVQLPASSKATIDDYYNAVPNAVVEYLKNNKQNLNSANVASLMRSLQDEQGSDAFNRILEQLIKQSVLAKGDDESISWVKEAGLAMFNNIATKLKDSNIQTILETLMQEDRIWYMIFGSSMKSLSDLVISKMTIADLSYPLLAVCYRLSEASRKAYDLLLINFVLNKQLVSIPKTATGSYDVDLSGQERLYNTTVRGWYSQFVALMAQSSRSPPADDPIMNLINLYKSADTANTNKLATLDAPETNPLCIAMLATNEKPLITDINAAIAKSKATKIAATALANKQAAEAAAQALAAKQVADKQAAEAAAQALASRCTLVSNMKNDECATYVNEQIAKNSAFGTSAVYKTILDAATNADGSLDKSIINKYAGMKQWLITNTADMLLLQNGATVIQHTCGKENKLTIDQCKRICEAYPETCTKDQIQKCQLPQYRYQEGFCQCSETSDNTAMIVAISILSFIIVVIFIAFVWFKRRRAKVVPIMHETQEETIESP